MSREIAIVEGKGENRAYGDVDSPAAGPVEDRSPT